MKIMMVITYALLLPVFVTAAELESDNKLTQSGVTYEQLIAESLAQQASSGVPPVTDANIYLVGYDPNGGTVDAGDFINVSVVFRSPQGNISVITDVPLLASSTWYQTLSPPSCPGGCNCFMDSSDYMRVRYQITSPPGCSWQPWGVFGFQVFINGQPVVGDKIYIQATHFWQYYMHYYGFTSNKLVLTIGQPL